MAISSTLDLRAVLNVLLEKIELFLPIAAATTVRLLNGATGELESLACRGLDEREWRLQQHTTLGGRAKKIVETRAPFALCNVVDDRDTYNSRIFRKHGLVSYLGVPLIAKEKPLGVLSLYTNHEHEFSKEEIEFLETLAGQAAIAIHNAQLHEQTKKQQLELIEQERIQRILKELSQDITTMDVDALLQKLTATVKEVFKVDFCDVQIFVRRSELTVSNLQPSDPSLEGRALGRGTTSAVIENRPLLAMREYKKRAEVTSGKPARKSAVRRFLSAALTSRGGEVLGAMRAISKEPREFTQQEVDLFEQLAHGAAIAVENSRLYTDLEKSNKVKSEFLSVMSHELRTPLNVIMGYTALIKDEMAGNANQGQRSSLTKIETQANELLAMVNNIVQATEIDGGGPTIRKHEVDVYELLQGLRVEYDSPLENDLVLLWQYPETLPTTGF